MKAKLPHRTGVQRDLHSRMRRFSKVQAIARRIRALKEAELSILQQTELKALKDFFANDIPDLLAEAYLNLNSVDNKLTRMDLRRINGVIINLDSALKAGAAAELSPWMRAMLCVLEQYDTSPPPFTMKRKE